MRSQNKDTGRDQTGPGLFLQAVIGFQGGSLANRQEALSGPVLDQFKSIPLYPGSISLVRPHGWQEEVTTFLHLLVKILPHMAATHPQGDVHLEPGNKLSLSLGSKQLQSTHFVPSAWVWELWRALDCDSPWKILFLTLALWARGYEPHFSIRPSLQDQLLWIQYAPYPVPTLVGNWGCSSPSQWLYSGCLNSSCYRKAAAFSRRNLQIMCLPCKQTEH